MALCEVTFDRGRGMIGLGASFNVRPRSEDDLITGQICAPSSDNDNSSRPEEPV